MDVIRAKLGLRSLVRMPPDLAAQLGRWFDDKDFSTDWASTHYAVWANLLSEMRGKQVDMLEIGSWEGRSAVFFLNYLPHSRIACVDTFAGDPKPDPNYPDAKLIEHAESRFDANMLPFQGRVEKIKSRSVPALDKLGTEGRRFDFVYIDGSHHGDNVLMDSLLCWPMLKEDGILIWDDYRYRGIKLDDSPGAAIDCFIKLHRASLSVVWRGYQVAVKKKR